ncbi:MAG: tetratricopeptide repeat protein [Proteobacteria bacterium]|nr:tetratricopeptide repeat protein [Pseudomonadota bacterium]
MEITREIAEQIHGQVVKAQDLAGAGKLVEAGKILAQALELCPEHPDANQVMGLLCFQQQKYQAARDHLQASLKGVPDQPFVLASLGQALIELKDLGGARGAFLKAIEAMPELGAAYGFLSEISRKQDLASLTGKIIQVFLNVEDLNPLTKVQLGFALTTCLEKLGQAEKISRKLLQQDASLLEPFRVEMGGLIDQDGFLAGKG